MRCQICRSGRAPHIAALMFSSSRSSIAGLGLFGALSILTFALVTFAQRPDPQQLFQDAYAAQQRGDAALAVSKYEELIRLHPEMTAARANLGIALVALGRFDEAIAQYRAALEQVHGDPVLRLDLALAWYKEAEFGKAPSERRRAGRARGAYVEGYGCATPG
ncbi:MAG: tetratricopeptide repeat protein [Terriglobia bacterium]